jgi:hypothetical protein
MRRLLACAVLAGCTTSSGSLPHDAAIADADWIEVELATGTVTALAEPETRTLAQPRWRSSHVLFRRVPAAGFAADGSLLPGGGESEDTAVAASDGRSFLAVFELTSAQWAALTGSAGGGQQPLVGIPAEEVALVLASTGLSRLRLDLPDAGLWTVACSGGRRTLFSWGDGLAEDAASSNAVHHPRSGVAPSGPSTVGSLLPNGLGLFDLHGNVWEMVRCGDGYEARGGAWDSPVLHCRTANRVDLPGELAVPNVGVRLALRP